MKRLKFAKNLDELQKKKKKKLFTQTIMDKIFETIFEIKRNQKGRENVDI